MGKNGSCRISSPSGVCRSGQSLVSAGIFLRVRDSIIERSRPEKAFTEINSAGELVGDSFTLCLCELGVSANCFMQSCGGEVLLIIYRLTVSLITGALG